MLGRTQHSSNRLSALPTSTSLFLSTWQLTHWAHKTHWAFRAASWQSKVQISKTWGARRKGVSQMGSAHFWLAWGLRASPHLSLQNSLYFTLLLLLLWEFLLSKKAVVISRKEKRNEEKCLPVIYWDKTSFLCSWGHPLPSTHIVTIWVQGHLNISFGLEDQPPPWSPCLHCGSVSSPPCGQRNISRAQHWSVSLHLFSKWCTYWASTVYQATCEALGK